MEEQNNQNFENNEPKEAVVKTSTAPDTKKPIPKMAIILGTIAVVAIVVVLIALLGGNNAGDNGDASNPSENPTHIHAFGEWATTKAATCTAEGARERFCGCGEKQTSAISMTEHIYGEWETVKEASCTQKGIKEKSCNCGKKTTMDIIVTGHSFSEWETVKEASCTENGIKEKSCNCGEKMSMDILAAGHSYNNGVVDCDPTCTETGSKIFTCTSCGNEKTENIPAKGHTESTNVTLHPTCADEGYEETICSVCNKVLATDSIPATRVHSYDNGVVTKNPSCSTTGTKLLTCTVCGYTKTSSISALGHSLNSNSICTVCGLLSLNMSQKEIEDSKKVKLMTHSASEYSDELFIYITLKDENEYAIQVPTYVYVKIVDDLGNIIYDKTIIKKASQNKVTISYDEIALGYTNTGTLYYKVYNDYVSFKELSQYLERIPWTVDVELPTLPDYIWDNGYSSSACNVTDITYSVSGDTIYFYFTGEKTYDERGDRYSRSCQIGWKLYDEDGYVIDDGVCYTSAIMVGEKFKNASSAAYDVIEQGKSYRLVILDVS